MQEFNAMLIWR